MFKNHAAFLVRLTPGTFSPGFFVGPAVSVPVTISPLAPFPSSFSSTGLFYSSFSAVSISLLANTLLTAPSFSKASICLSLNSHNFFATFSSITSFFSNLKSLHSFRYRPPTPRPKSASIAAYKKVCAPCSGDFSISHQTGHISK